MGRYFSTGFASRLILLRAAKVRRQFEPVVSELTVVLSGEGSGGFLSIMRTITCSSAGSSYIRERDYYEILGIPKDAAVEDIKKAFHNASSLKAESVSYDGEDAAQYHETHHDPFSATFYKFFSEVFENERLVVLFPERVELNLRFMKLLRAAQNKIIAQPAMDLELLKVLRVLMLQFLQGSILVILLKCQKQETKVKGCFAGDLHIKLQVAKDPVFHRDEADIYVDANISFTQRLTKKIPGFGSNRSGHVLVSGFFQKLSTVDFQAVAGIS
ncbi:hypothetical protein HPP92_003825 [Vanilla planifolia]|uniref:Chaperone DnaJ C-terminal domain-containing protein n=1 Tax=Vanilla planifolia TaxID=51239 RepID=A0A835VNW7_VANPL|nr:hypothetical protein HPP92_003825 [Vanilla planifolia]